jgi:hypothetical protein
MGHDSFTIEDRKLVRMFPLYSEGDTNENPTAGRRKLVYGLVPHVSVNAGTYTLVFGILCYPDGIHCFGIKVNAVFLYLNQARLPLWQL